MKSIRRAALGALLMAATALPMMGQATRTWVSGVGDDVNPCSRTAPCKTFAGAMSKTATGGEINVLDPGGFGAVTINKSMTIDGRPFEASLLSSGVNGVNVNITSGEANPVVTLRNIQINGAGTGINGVNVTGAGTTKLSLRLEGVTIFGVSQRGINLNPTVQSEVSVSNTIIQDCGTIGIAAITANIKLDVSNSQIISCASDGVFITAGNVASISHSVIHSNGAAGVVMNGANTKVTIADSVLSRNAIGAQGGTGAGSSAGAVLGLSNNTITGNTTGVQVNGATVETHGNNAIRRNTTDISALTGSLTSVGVQ
jgi:hypothetical protein